MEFHHHTLWIISDAFQLRFSWRQSSEEAYRKNSLSLNILFGKKLKSIPYLKNKQEYSQIKNGRTLFERSSRCLILRRCSTSFLQFSNTYIKVGDMIEKKRFRDKFELLAAVPGRSRNSHFLTSSPYSPLTHAILSHPREHRKHSPPSRSRLPGKTIFLE